MATADRTTLATDFPPRASTEITHNAKGTRSASHTRRREQNLEQNPDQQNQPHRASNNPG